MPQTAHSVSPVMITLTGGASSSSAPTIHNAMTPSTNGRRPNSAMARPTHGTIGLEAR